jgi:alcohol dehydrogenase YqhD (iron-dependent ADH family)
MSVAQYMEIYIQQGANFASEITITDSTTNAVMNIASMTFVGRLKRSYASSNVKANLEFTATDAANGVLEYSIPSEVTANLKEGRYVFNVKMTANNETVPIIEGGAFVLPDV